MRLVRILESPPSNGRFLHIQCMNRVVVAGSGFCFRGCLISSLYLACWATSLDEIKKSISIFFDL